MCFRYYWPLTIDHVMDVTFMFKLHMRGYFKSRPRFTLKKQVYDLNFFSGKRSGGTKSIGRVVKKPT